MSLASFSFQSDEIKIVPLSDFHFGHRACQVDAIQGTIDYIKNSENTYTILMGDMIESSSKTSVGAGWLDQKITPDEQMDTIVDMLKPIQPKILGAITGNHEARAWKDVGFDVTKRYCRELGIPYWGIGKLIRIKVKDYNYVFYVFHGSSKATTAQGKMLACKKLRNTAEADIYCLSPDTEIWTYSGWKKMDEVSVGDKIATLNPKTLHIEDDVILRIYKKQHDGDMIHIENQHIDILVTPEHRVFKKNRDYYKSKSHKHVIGEWGFHTADHVYNLKGQQIIPVSGITEKLKYNLSERTISLLGWIISEGHFCKGRKRLYENFLTKHGGITITQRESNAHKIRNLLQQLGLKYSESIRDNVGRIIRLDGKKYFTKERTIVFYIYSKDGYKIRKILDSKGIPDWMYSLSKYQVDVLLDSLIEGDGHRYSDNSCAYYSGDEKLIDDLQRLLVVNGYRTEKSKRKRGWQLLISRNTTTEISQSSKRERIKYNGAVWCIDTNNTTIITRRNGKIAILGNCLAHTHHLAVDSMPIFRPNIKDKVVDIGKKYFVLTGYYVDYWGTYAHSSAFDPGKTGSSKIKLFGDRWDIHVSV